MGTATPAQKKTIRMTMQAQGMGTTGNVDALSKEAADKLISALFSHNEKTVNDILGGLPNDVPAILPDPPTEILDEETLPAQKLAQPIASVSESAYYENLESHLGQAVKMVRMFQDAKAKVLSPGDVVDIKGHSFIKRSGWRKIGLLFGVQWEILSVDREGTDKGKRQVRVIVRASLPYGRYVDEIAVNNSEEYSGMRAGQDTWHNLEATATSRAINRAVSDLIGAGEVSAEEIVGDA